jgi:threonyl-tRNA synthetase
MASELHSLLSFVLDLLRDFGLEDFYLELSTRPEEKAVGTDEEWEEATEALRQAALSMDLELTMDPGGGAFYGPKISVQVRDAIGRTWQISTIQVDFQMPQRFAMEYVGQDNARHQPIMIHRALFGSVERFFAILLEHYAGAFPTWLAPVQVRVLPVRDDHADYAREVRALLAAAGVRAEADEADEPLGARIRKAKLEKLPYILVVGDMDIAARTVGVNARGSSACASKRRLRCLAAPASYDPRPPLGGLAVELCELVRGGRRARPQAGRRGTARVRVLRDLGCRGARRGTTRGLYGQAHSGTAQRLPVQPGPRDGPPAPPRA